METRWVSVKIPNPPKRYTRNTSEALAAKALRVRLERERLLEFLRNPPEDFDGGNAKIATSLGVSARTVSRWLATLQEEGSVKLTNVINKFGGGIYTTRYIQVVEKT